MSEVLTPRPGNVAGVSASGLLLSCSALLLSSLVSHLNPMFSYFMKLASFLCPLLFTTFLVLLALLTLSPNFVLGGMSEPGLSSLMGICSSILNKFRTNADEFDVCKDSEVYRIIFEAPDAESSQYSYGDEESELPVDKFLIYGDDGVRDASLPSKREEEDRPVQENACPNAEPGKKLGALMENLWVETECSEETEVEEKVKAGDEDSKKVVEEEEKQMFHDSQSDLTRESEVKIDDRDDDIKNNHRNTIFSRRQGSRRLGESSSRAYENVLVGGELDRNLGSFGSMSRSKEWKRTLACKLFEERHNAEGEGMDSLWETYEEDTSRKDSAKTRKEKKAIKGWKKEGVDSVIRKVDDEEGADEVEMDDKFCCLQALRLSAGRKMGLGIGIRPNIIRMSKAFKGMSWLHHHHVVSPGHGKKG